MKHTGKIRSPSNSCCRLSSCLMLQLEEVEHHDSSSSRLSQSSPYRKSLSSDSFTGWPAPLLRNASTNGPIEHSCILRFPIKLTRPVMSAWPKSPPWSGISPLFLHYQHTDCLYWRAGDRQLTSWSSPVHFASKQTMHRLIPKKIFRFPEGAVHVVLKIGEHGELVISAS